MRSSAFLVAWAIITAAGPVRAETIPEAFARGIDLFSQGRFEESARIFRELRDQYDVDSPAVIVNLGAAEFSAGRPGRALLHFHQVLKNVPGSSAAELASVNAERVRTALNRNQGESPQSDGFVFGRYHDPWTATMGWMNPRAAMAVFLVCWFLLFGFLGLRRLTDRQGRARRLSWLALAAATAAVLTGIAAYGATRVADYRIGVVLIDQSDLYDDVASVEASLLLPEGLEVRILDTLGGFAQVRLSSGRTGFVPVRSLGIL